MALLVLVAGIPALWPTGALAQEEELSPLERLMAQQDSLQSTEPDSVDVPPAEDAVAFIPYVPWWDPLVPTLDARVTSDLTRVVLNGGIEAPVGRFVPDWEGRARLTGTETSYRQFDRDAEALNFNLTLNGGFSGFGDVDLGAIRNWSYDENRSAGGGGQPLVLENEVRELRATLRGARDLGQGLRAAWGLRGEVESAERTDRGITNNRDLAGGGVTALWGTRGPWHDFSARYGYDRQEGDRALRDLTGDAQTERDTLWVRGELNFGLRLNIDLDARRTTFVEDRLDFARNENGVVDTLNVISPVGDENESTWQNSWDLDVKSRPFPRLAVNAAASQTYSESRYVLSRAGLVQVGREELEGETILRYAEAGSLRVRYTRSDRTNDRRPRGSSTFRGDETRLTQRADAQFRHRASQLIDIHLDLQQSLDQNINENPNNVTDRDRLVTRGDLKVISDPWSWFQAEMAGSYSVEELINIDAARVNSNQTTDLFEVRGNFIVDPPGGWRFIQNYRMQIRLIDRVVGIEDDEFAKQGNWDSRIQYLFPNGISTDAQYVIDYRRNGDRDPDRPEEEVYIYRGAKRDHRLLFGLRIPVGVAELEARTERGFLRDNSPTVPVSQDRGKITVGLRGNWKFWNDRGTLTLNGSKIYQFGPLVREETKDYWVMNTSLRVAF